MPGKGVLSGGGAGGVEGATAPGQQGVFLGNRLWTAEDLQDSPATRVAPCSQCPSATRSDRHYAGGEKPAGNAQMRSHPWDTQPKCPETGVLPLAANLQQEQSTRNPLPDPGGSGACSPRRALQMSPWEWEVAPCW